MLMFVWGVKLGKILKTDEDPEMCLVSYNRRVVPLMLDTCSKNHNTKYLNKRYRCCCRQWNKTAPITALSSNAISNP